MKIATGRLQSSTKSAHFGPILVKLGESLLKKSGRSDTRRKLFLISRIVFYFLPASFLKKEIKTLSAAASFAREKRGKESDTKITLDSQCDQMAIWFVQYHLTL